MKVIEPSHVGKREGLLNAVNDLTTQRSTSVKIKLTAVALLASVVGFVAGQLGGNVIKPAYAAGNVLIKVDLANSPKAFDAELSKCNFDKTIVPVGIGIYYCVKN